MHEPVLVPAGILQKQSMLQDICLLQMPPQKGLMAAWFRNWRAETVPAKRTAVTIVARNVDLIIFLPMIAPGQWQRWTTVGSFAPSYFVEGLRPGGSLTQPPVVAPSGIQQKQGPLQATVALQVPRQKVIAVGWLRSTRAETVPAKRTAVTMVASNVGFIILPMIALLSNYRAG
jgi:hypothetical protein